MKTLKSFIACLMAISTLAQGQEYKINLRNFTSIYSIDTFSIKGNATFLKRRVINFQQAEGAKSAYWDEYTNVLSVQYNSKLLSIFSIKSFFLDNIQLPLKKSYDDKGVAIKNSGKNSKCGMKMTKQKNKMKNVS